MFNWSAESGQTIILRHFWVYWAFAIPLTLFVLAVWLLFMTWSELRRKRNHGKRQKRRIGRLNAKHPSGSLFSRIKVRRKRIRAESDPENMNETRPRDKATPEQQETVEQIVYMDAANTETILVGGKHEESKQRRVDYRTGYDYLFPRIDPDPDPPVDAMGTSQSKLGDLDRSRTLYQR